VIHAVLHHLERLFELTLHNDVHDDHCDDASDPKFDLELLLEDFLEWDLCAQHYIDADNGLEEPDDEHVFEVGLGDLVAAPPHVFQPILLHLRDELIGVV